MGFTCLNPEKFYKSQNKNTRSFYKVLLSVTLRSWAVFFMYKAAFILAVSACFGKAIRIMSRGALEGHTHLLEKLI